MGSVCYSNIKYGQLKKILFLKDFITDIKINQ